MNEKENRSSNNNGILKFVFENLLGGISNKKVESAVSTKNDGQNHSINSDVTMDKSGMKIYLFLTIFEPY